MDFWFQTNDYVPIISGSNPMHHPSQEHLILHVHEPWCLILPAMVRPPSLPPSHVLISFVAWQMPAPPSMFSSRVRAYSSPSFPQKLLSISSSRSQRHRDLGPQTWPRRIRNAPRGQVWELGPRDRAMVSWWRRYGWMFLGVVTNYVKPADIERQDVLNGEKLKLAGGVGGVTGDEDER